MPPSTHPLLRSIARWADGRPDVRAVVLTGSRTAEEGTGDSVADFDVEVAVDDPGALADGAWLDRIAAVLVAADDEQDGDPTWLVFFAGQQKVEFRLRRAGDAGAPDGRSPVPAGHEVLFARARRGPDAVGPADAVDAPATVDDAPGPGAPRRVGVPAATPVRLRALAPVFAAADVPAWLAHYRQLGFAISSEDERSGVATRDGLELRVVRDPDDGPAARGLARLTVDDPGALAHEWSAVPGGRTVAPPAAGDRDGLHADPAGNVLRFGPAREDAS